MTPEEKKKARFWSCLAAVFSVGLPVALWLAVLIGLVLIPPDFCRENPTFALVLLTLGFVYLLFGAVSLQMLLIYCFEELLRENLPGYRFLPELALCEAEKFLRLNPEFTKSIKEAIEKSKKIDDATELIEHIDCIKKYLGATQLIFRFNGT